MKKIFRVGSFSILELALTKFQPPTNDSFLDYEQALFSRSLDPLTTIIGSKETVERKIEEVIEQTQADELIISSSIYEKSHHL